MESHYIKELENIVSTYPEPIKNNIVVTTTQIKEQEDDESLVRILRVSTDYLSHLVPEITHDIINSNDTGKRKNYYDEYKHINENVVKCAIEIAEQTIYNTYNRYKEACG